MENIYLKAFTTLSYLIVYGYLAAEDYTSANKKGEGEVSVAGVFMMAIIGIIILISQNINLMLFTISLITWAGVSIAYYVIKKKSPLAWADWTIVLTTPLFLTQLVSFYVFITMNALFAFWLFKNKPFYPMFTTSYLAFLLALFVDFGVRGI
jgi:hypothetical protein